MYSTAMSTDPTLRSRMNAANPPKLRWYFPNFPDVTFEGSVNGVTIFRDPPAHCTRDSVARNLTGCPARQ